MCEKNSPIWRSSALIVGMPVYGSITTAIAIATALSVSMSVAYGQSVDVQELPDLDSDGVADVYDLDQDNDGIINELEGVYRLQDLAGSPASAYIAVPSNDVRGGSSYEYNLLSSDNGADAVLAATVVETNTEVEWSMHGALPKLRNLTSGSSTVRWSIEVLQPARGVDLTISDLDGVRSETVVVSAASVVGYSLSLNTNVVVRSGSGKLSFTGTGSGGESVDDLVTLHFRNVASMVVTYSNGFSGANNAYGGDLIGEAEIAGFRHSLEQKGFTYFTPVTQYRDSDLDGIADHRDLDSDNDGFSDVVESGGIDADADNIFDGAVDDRGIPLNANRQLNEATLADVYRGDNVVFGDDYDGDGLLSSIDALPEEFGGAFSAADSDSDGLLDLDEIRIYRTNPNLTDTDQDGVGDHAEITHYNTSPLQEDTDRDGLSDGDEVYTYDTLPTNVDTDADGIDDGEEVLSGSDPLLDESIIVVIPGPQSIAYPDPAVVEESVTDEVESTEVIDGVLDNAVPETGALMDDPSHDEPVPLRTGLSGAGCAITSASSLEPLLPMMLMLAIVGLVRKSRGSNTSA